MTTEALQQTTWAPQQFPIVTKELGGPSKKHIEKSSTFGNTSDFLEAVRDEVNLAKERDSITFLPLIDHSKSLSSLKE